MPLEILRILKTFLWGFKRAVLLSCVNNRAVRRPATHGVHAPQSPPPPRNPPHEKAFNSRVSHINENTSSTQQSIIVTGCDTLWSSRRWSLTWAQQGVPDSLGYPGTIRAQCQGKKRKKKQKLSGWILRASVCALQMFGKMLLREARCRAFPKHWETWAFNIEESSGPVYPPAARHAFRIGFNNFTWHFGKWYFRKPHSPIVHMPSLYCCVFDQKKGSVFLRVVCDRFVPTDSFSILRQPSLNKCILYAFTCSWSTLLESFYLCNFGCWRSQI